VKIDELMMHQVFQLTRIISQNLNSQFSPYNLHFSEWSIIVALMEKGKMIQGDLASYLNIEPSAVSRSLVGLQKKGYIMREEGIDRRERKISLTEIAIKHYNVWERIADQYRQSLLADFSEEKKNELYMALKTIFQAAQCTKNDKI